MTIKADHWLAGVSEIPVGVGEILDELEWSTLEVRREQAPLFFLYKIYIFAVSIDKSEYFTPAPALKQTRASRNWKYIP